MERILKQPNIICFYSFNDIFNLNGTILDLLDYSMFLRFNGYQSYFLVNNYKNYLYEIQKYRYKVFYKDLIIDSFNNEIDILITSKEMILKDKTKHLNFKKLLWFNTSSSFKYDVNIGKEIGKYIWFDGIQEPSFCEDNIFVNLISYIDIYNDDEIKDIVNILNSYQNKKVILIRKDQFRKFMNKYKNIENYQLFFNYLPIFFNKFSKYFIYKSKEHYDYSPRLILECKYLNKEIIYINRYDITDGIEKQINMNIEDRALKNVKQILGDN
jgi:hypothetical protein